MHSANSYGLVCCLWACWFVLGSKGWGNAGCCVSVYQYAGDKVYIHLIHIHIHKKQNKKTWHGALFHLDMVVVRGPTAWSDGHSWLPGTWYRCYNVYLRCKAPLALVNYVHLVNGELGQETHDLFGYLRSFRSSPRLENTLVPPGGESTRLVWWW